MKESDARNKMCPILSAVFFVGQEQIFQEIKCKGSSCQYWDDWECMNYSIVQKDSIKYKQRIENGYSISKKNNKLSNNNVMVEKKVNIGEGDCGAKTKDCNASECNYEC